jgi:uncharacterized protein YraI
VSSPFIRRFSIIAPAVAAGCWIAGVPVAATAADQLVAYTTTSVNMRGGPDTTYQVIQQVPERTRIVVDGCLQSLDWCEVEYQQQRGWMSADYIQAYYQGTYYLLLKVASDLQIPVVTFDTAQQDQSSAQQGQSSQFSQTSGGVTNIDAGVFYERLAPYGSWVLLSGSYVWVPTRVSSNWRPYEYGRWVDTDQYGWMWVSSEPFGWATYHYGRWGYSKRIGWFWVPGSRWAPAWVAWRSSGTYLAWAPLPPEESSGVNVSINININEVPNYYWVVVPTARFLSTDLNTVVVNQQQAVIYLQQTQPLGTVQLQGQEVINNVVNVQTIQSQTQQRVVTHQVSTVQDPQATTQISGNTVQIFAPQLQNGASTGGPTKPPQVAPLTQVEQQSQTKGQAGDQPATDNLLQSSGQQPASNQQPGGSQQLQTNAPVNGQQQPTNNQQQQQQQQPAAGQQQQPTNGQQPPSTSGNQQQNCVNGAQTNGNCLPSGQPSSGKNGSSTPAQPGAPSSSTNGGALGNEPPPPQSTTPSTSQPPSPANSGANGSSGSNQPSTAPSTSSKAIQPNTPSSGSSQGTSNEPPPPTSTTPSTSQPPALQGTSPNGQGATAPQGTTTAPGTTKGSAPSLQQSCPKGTVVQSDGSCGASSNGSSSKSSGGSSGMLQPSEPPPPPSSSPSGSSSSRSGSPSGAGPCPKGTTVQGDGSCAAGPPTRMTGEPKTRGGSLSGAGVAPSSGSGDSMNGVPSRDVGTGQSTDQTTTQSLSPAQGLQPAPRSRYLQRQGCPGGTAQLPDGSCGQVLQHSPLQQSPQPLPQ